MIKIPTADELKTKLSGLDRLLTAKRWEKAAIVWAFTITGEPGRPGKEPVIRQFPCSISEFARLGFGGLSQRDTVTRYRKAWQDAIDLGAACSVEPGDEVDLPNLPFPSADDPSLVTAGTAYETAEDRAEDIRRLSAQVGEAKGALRVATSAPNTLRVVAQTATDEQAQALVEGLRQRGIEQSESYVQSLNDRQHLLDSLDRSPVVVNPEDIESETSARAGSIPPLEELNRNRQDHPVVDAVQDEIQQLSPSGVDVISQLESAVRAVQQAGPFGDDTPAAARLRACSLGILDAIADRVRP
jgi:hypothetical protein